MPLLHSRHTTAAQPVISNNSAHRDHHTSDIHPGVTAPHCPPHPHTHWTDLQEGGGDNPGTSNQRSALHGPITELLPLIHSPPALIGEVQPKKPKCDPLWPYVTLTPWLHRVAQRIPHVCVKKRHYVKRRLV